MLLEEISQFLAILYKFTVQLIQSFRHINHTPFHGSWGVVEEWWLVSLISFKDELFSVTLKLL